MKILKWLKKKQPKIEMVRLYNLIMHHTNGTSIEINNVSDPSLKFIQQNIGRDEIYIHDTMCLNLHEFYLIEFSIKDSK